MVSSQKDAFVVYRNYILQIFLLGHYPHLHLLQQLYYTNRFNSYGCYFFVKKEEGFFFQKEVSDALVLIYTFLSN